MPEHQVILPPEWPRPKGYANGILAAPGRLLFVAGQIGWDTQEKLVSSEFLAQFVQALDNVLAVVRAAGGAPAHVARLTVYVTDKQAYIAQARAIGAAYRERFQGHYAAMSLLQVADLLEPGAQVEIEATAVIPVIAGAAPDAAPQEPSR